MNYVEDRDEVLQSMANLWERQLSPEFWPEPLRQIFAQACIPFVRSLLPIRTILGIEHAKGLRLAGRMWQGCTTQERLPQWLIDIASSGQRNPDLEILAEHVRQHLTREMYKRSHAVSRP